MWPSWRPYLVFLILIAGNGSWVSYVIHYVIHYPFPRIYHIEFLRMYKQSLEYDGRQANNTHTFFAARVMYVSCKK